MNQEPSTFLIFLQYLTKTLSDCRIPWSALNSVSVKIFDISAHFFHGKIFTAQNIFFSMTPWGVKCLTFKGRVNKYCVLGHIARAWGCTRYHPEVSQWHVVPFRALARAKGANSSRLFTPGERKALAKSKVHQWFPMVHDYGIYHVRFNTVLTAWDSCI